jgi:Spy/CpxP family protein refolding chaperone
VNRFVATLSVLALLLSGIAVGGLAVQLYHSRRGGPPPIGPPPDPPPGPRPGPPPGPPPIEELSRRLSLTQEQTRTIAAILAESRVKSEALRRELRPRLEAQLAETRRRVDGVLTPDQRARLADLERDRPRMERFWLGGPPPPPPEPDDDRRPARPGDEPAEPPR